MLRYQYEVEYYYISGGEVSRDEYIEIMLGKIGKEIFARYYYDFKREDPDLYKVIEEPYSISSKKRRTSYAISLFRQGLAKDALYKVAKAKRIDPVMARYAAAVYSCEFRENIYDQI